MPANGNISPSCIQVIPHSVSHAMNEKLDAPFSITKIERATFALGALKALGPDGLNGEFFQKNWETIKSDVENAV